MTTPTWRNCAALLAAVTVVAACGGSPERPRTPPRAVPTASATPVRQPSCLPPIGGPARTSAWTQLSVRDVDILPTPSLTVPARTELLPAGPAPRRAWVERFARSGVLHLEGRELRVTRWVETILGHGYLTTAGRPRGPGSLVWQGLGGRRRVLAQWPEGVLAGEDVSATGDLTWLLEYRSSPRWRLFVRTRRGCQEELPLPGVAETSAGRAREDCDLHLLGFVSNAEVATALECIDASTEPTTSLDVVTTSSGRRLTLPGVRHVAARQPTASLRGQVLLSISPQAVVRAFRLPEGKPLWSIRYTSGGRRTPYESLGVSPSGRRALLRGGDQALVIDTRTGSPVRRITLSPNTLSALLDDDDHLLLTDNGDAAALEDRTRTSPPPSWWVVTCALSGPCRLATAPRPAGAEYREIEVVPAMPD